MNSTYLLVDFFTIIVPFIFSFHPELKFSRHFKAFFLANILAAAIFIAWDILFTKLGVWGFNPDYIIGINFINLPLEEILFFICIPFSCVFTYHCINLFIKIRWQKRTGINIVSICAGILLIAGICFYNRLYTSSTFISLSLFIFTLIFFRKEQILARLITIYPVLLLPFFIVNGILTGSGLNQPVVWYNDMQNLGIRIITIPLEDFFYGFELILLNILIFEYLKSRFNKTEIKI